MCGKAEGSDSEARLTGLSNQALNNRAPISLCADDAGGVSGDSALGPTSSHKSRVYEMRVICERRRPAYRAHRKAHEICHFNMSFT
jgi:hypothetical protein